uniref:Uncharacterized protein n=1 Tax=Romanomermis culicivorax TaxID=13658 RepID=A0A915IMS1_ROMCU
MGVLSAKESNRNLYNDRPKRVVGPDIAEPLCKPWSVYLAINRFRCGGFLLDVNSLSINSTYLPPENSSDIVITAAHCVLTRIEDMLGCCG